MLGEKFVSNEARNEHDHTDTIIAAGIAERMLATLQKYNGGSPFEYELDDLRFWVEREGVVEGEEDSGGGGELRVVVQMPNKHKDTTGEPFVTEAFAVEQGGSFGAFGEAPLTNEQFELVTRLAGDV